MGKILEAKQRMKQALTKRLRELKKESASSYFLAVVPRVLFLVHAVIAIRLLKNIVRTSNPGEKLNSTPLYTGIMLLFVESLYTIVARRGHENKHVWFSGFLYLATLVPTIWLLELNFLQRRQASRYSATVNSTDIASTSIVATSASLRYWKCISDVGECDVQFVKNCAELGLIGVIIIGRWMLPRGDLTRDQLSALLLGYINVAADITEFIGFHSKLTGTKYSWTVVITVLSIYSISLLQFVLVTTSTTYEYNEQEKELIASITSDAHNLPRYLQPHARRLRRSSVSRNIDSMALHAFAAGQRSGSRRANILSGRKISKHNTRLMTGQNGYVKNGAMEPNSSSINETSMGRVDKGYEMRKFDASKEYSVKGESYDEVTGKTQEQKPTNRSGRSNQALEKWTSNAMVSRRLYRFRQLIIEENWQELSNAIVDLKSAGSSLDGRKARAARQGQLPFDALDEKLNSLLKEQTVELEQQEEDKMAKLQKMIEMLQSEMGATLIALFFQECPFLVTRVMFMYQFDVLDRGLVFYTIKNVFMLIFLSYKLWVSATE
eukprot:gene15375-16955_t